MNKTLTLTANNRPHYLAMLLESLRGNNTAGYTLHCQIEPGCAEVRRLCESIDWMPATVTVNESRLGVRGNPYRALEAVFECPPTMGGDTDASDFNVYLEDDIILAPDALDLCNWFAEHPDARGVVSLQLFNYFSYPTNPMARWEGEPAAGMVCVGQNGLFPHFSALGLAMHRESWFRHFKPQWWVHPSGWDWSIESYLLSQYGNGRRLTMAQPIVARANHTGREGGTHCQADFHDRTFGRIKMHDGPPPAYRLEAFEWQPGRRPGDVGVL